MYSMVLMAALTTGTDMPDRRGGCHGCSGGCYGGMGMGMGYGGCYGGMGMGMGYGYGGGYAMGAYSPVISGYAYSPVISGYAYSPVISWWGTGVPIASAAEMTQSFYRNPNAANEATLVVHLPESASLSIDGQPMKQSSSTRTFTSPPLEPGKTYVYKVTAEMNRNGHVIKDTKNVEVRAGQRSEVTMNFGDVNRREEESREELRNAPPPRSSPRGPLDR